jgi:predicted DNA-binding protein YlxM (UPF0122 family)
MLRGLHEEIIRCHNEIEEYKRRLDICLYNQRVATTQYNALNKLYDKLEEEYENIKDLYDEVRGKSNK